MKDYGEYLKAVCEEENTKIGYLNYADNINCDKCLNRGYFAYCEDTDLGFYKFAKPCECMKIRKLNQVMKTSGLGDLLKIYKLENYKTTESWQKSIYESAVEFINKPTNCFYIGGQVGAGKSHICTAIVGNLVKKGYSLNVKYAVWNDIVTILKQQTYEDINGYSKILNDLKNVNILFIDDLFKTEPTKTDIDKAFQIINHRYNLARTYKDECFITIISSEKTYNELSLIDESLSSRIYEMAQKKNIISISKDRNKNYRLKGE